MKRFLLLASVMGYCSATAQVIYPYRTCTSPVVLKEFSGIAKVGSNLLAGINDGGNQPAVYFMDTTGKLLRIRKFTTIGNIDWEEIFYHESRLYMADVGDNLNQRKKITVYEYDVVKDTLVGQTDFGFAEKNEKNLADKDKHYDCEAGFWANDHFYFFTKTHAVPYTGKSLQYTVTPGVKYKMYQAVDSAFFGHKGFIYNSLTGAALSPSGNTVAFISCTRLWLRFFPEAGKYLKTGWLMEFTFDGLTQKEAVTFLNDEGLVVADEKTMGLMGGRLYFFNVRQYTNGDRTYAKPSVQKALVKEKKGGVYTLDFENQQPLKEITLVLVGTRGNVLHTQKVLLKNNKVSTDIKYEGKKTVAFWICDGDKILYTSKIKRT